MNVPDVVALSGSSRKICHFEAQKWGISFVISWGFHRPTVPYI